MNTENELFKKYTPNYKKLEKYGFKKIKNSYQYDKLFHNNEFKTIINITNDGVIAGKVFDIENNDEFLPLKIETQNGAFIGEIREEYKKILIDIREKCYNKNYFISNQANRITSLIEKEYGNLPEFLWKQYTGYAVFRNRNKWYAIIGNINRLNLGENNNLPVEVINIKIDKNKIEKLLKKKGYYPAWHMNKKTWITITLDETLSDNEIFNLIKESHAYTERIEKEWIIPANPQYYDIADAFNNNKEIIWKQSSNINIGDIAYIYLASPISAILYKCKVTQTNIPYQYEDKNLRINKVMKIKLLKKYDNNFMTIEKLKKYGIKAIRGQRTCPDELNKILK